MRGRNDAAVAERLMAKKNAVAPLIRPMPGPIR